MSIRSGAGSDAAGRFDLLTDVAGFMAGLLVQRFAAALAARVQWRPDNTGF